MTLIWPDGAIQKQWLQVLVKADSVTGLATPDVFYFGNAVGDSGNNATNAYVDGTDFAGARDQPHNFLDRAEIDDRYDYNRDSFVDGTDLAIARDHGTNFLTALKLITVPVAVPLAMLPAASGGRAEGESGLLFGPDQAVYAGDGAWAPWDALLVFNHLNGVADGEAGLFAAPVPGATPVDARVLTAAGRPQASDKLSRWPLVTPRDGDTAPSPVDADGAWTELEPLLSDIAVDIAQAWK